MIIDIILIILVFIWFWFSSFERHESNHCYEACRQGATETTIKIKFKKIYGLLLPTSAHMNYWGDVHNKDMISLAGGLYTGLQLFPLAFIALYARIALFYIPLFTISVVQLCYGLFEMRYIRTATKTDYLIGRYSLYGLVLFFMSIFWYGLWFYGWLI